MVVFPPRLRMSGGERNFLFAICGVGVLSAIFASMIVLRLSAHAPADFISDPFAAWTFLAGAAGGVGAFLSIYHRWLGFAGTSGWVRAAVGGLMISFIGAVAGGTLILPYYGTMFGPFQLIIAMIEMPLLGAIWIMMMICAHKLLVGWRAERDSIFNEDEPLV